MLFRFHYIGTQYTAGRALGLKEQTETVKMYVMKIKTAKQRFDLVAMLAVFGCLAVVLFESIFIFELYRFVPDTVLRRISGAAQKTEIPVPEAPADESGAQPATGTPEELPEPELEPDLPVEKSAPVPLSPVG